jgi:hypothetical protein
MIAFRYKLCGSLINLTHTLFKILEFVFIQNFTFTNMWTACFHKLLVAGSYSCYNVFPFFC